MKAIAITAVAGIAAAASAQGLAVHFAADASQIVMGDTVNWTVSVTATGYADASAYLGGFVGSLNASDNTLGTASNLVSGFGQSATTPTYDGADVDGINTFNSALLGTDDQALVDALTFSVTASDQVGDLSYGFAGVWSYFASDFIFALPDEYTEGDVSVTSDVVGVNIPAPGALALAGLGGLVASRRRR